jgi:prefoldin subunit 5
MNDYLDLYLDYMVEEVQNQSTSNTRKQHIDEAKKTINDSKQTQKMIKKAIVLCLACIGLGIWLANNYTSKKMYEQQVSNLKETLNGLKHDNEELKRRVGALTNATNKLNASQKDTNSRVNDLESRTKRLNSRLSKIDGPNGQLDQLNDEIRSTRETLKKLGRKVGQTVETLEKQKKTYEMIERSIINK